MTDYLALIAEKTVECPVTLKSDNRDGSAGQHGDLCDCKGSGRVLDPRFDGLRLHQHEVKVSCLKGCQGYSGVSRDLAVLLEIALKIVPCADGLNFELIDGKFKCEVWESYFGHSLVEATADTFIEAAAKAVWEWLEAEEKVASDD